MRNSDSKEIDGMTFTVVMLPATRALQVFYKIVGVLGPAAGKGLQGVDIRKGVGSMDIGAIGALVQTIAERFSPSDLQTLLKDLLEGSLVKTEDGKGARLPEVIDVLLAGKVMTLLKVLAFALEVNFADFFGALRGNLLAPTEVK